MLKTSSNESIAGSFTNVKLATRSLTPSGKPASCFRKVLVAFICIQTGPQSQIDGPGFVKVKRIIGVGIPHAGKQGRVLNHFLNFLESVDVEQDGCPSIILINYIFSINYHPFNCNAKKCLDIRKNRDIISES